MSITAFSPQAKTYAFSVTSSAGTGVQLQPSTSYGAMQYRVINSGTNLAFLGVGATAALAVTNTVIPTPGTPTLAIPLLPGTDEVFTFPQGAYFAAVTSGATTTTLYITSGDGM